MGHSGTAITLDGYVHVHPNVKAGVAQIVQNLHAGHELVGQAAQVVEVLRTEEEVALAGKVPGAEVDVAKVAYLVGEGFGSERGVEPVPPGHV